MPVISVIMVFHRDGPYFRQAIASIFGQTLRDWELVLVDNGTGMSPNSLGCFGRDPRIQWVRLPINEGIPVGHNAGVAAARSDLIALLDYDDIALPTRLEKQVELLRAEPSLGLVSSQAQRIDKTGNVLGREFSLMSSGAQREYLRYASPVVTPAYSGRREVFASLPYRTCFPFTADFDFLARASERWRLGAVTDVLLHYRWHASQTTQQKAAAMEQAYCPIRIMTARRRAGREERYQEVACEMMQPTPAPADSCRNSADRCLVEGFFALAAYHARRSFLQERTPRNFFCASRLAWQSIATARGEERRRAANLFFRGPVRALGLTPE